MKVRVVGDIKLIVRHKDFEIAEDVSFLVDDRLFIIPKGMRTDLGSVPGLLRAFIDTHGKKTHAYILHDYGYREQPTGTDRKFWDKVLREQMKNDGIGSFKRGTIYRGLRTGGMFAWNKNKKKLENVILEG